MLNAYQLSQCLYVASELGIADLLKDGPKHYEELARASDAHPQSLLRLLRALASAGILVQRPGDWFELNDLAQYLRRDAPDSLRAWAILSGQQFYPTWGHLLYSVKTGEIAFDHLSGMSVWQHRAQNSAAGQVFDEAMHGVAHASHLAVVDAYDFARFDCVVDVGGGHGDLLATILGANPGLRGVLFDQESVVQAGKDYLKQIQVLERCKIIGGDFLEAVPAEGDAYILKRIIQDWDDQRAIQILHNCRRAMQSGQTLLIVERIMALDHPSLETTLTDVMMMVMNGGRERSETDFRALLNAAGFELPHVTATDSIFHIIASRAV